MLFKICQRTVAAEVLLTGSKVDCNQVLVCKMLAWFLPNYVFENSTFRLVSVIVVNMHGASNASTEIQKQVFIQSFPITKKYSLFYAC